MLTIPNVLTLLRLVAVPVFLFASWHGDFRLAFVLFIAAALTDILDGWIARRFNQRSQLGAILDPAADKTMMVCGYLFFTLRPNLPRIAIPGWLTFLVLIRDVMLVLFAYLLYTRVQITRFPPSWAGKLSTLSQAVTLAATIGTNSYFPRLRQFTQICFPLTLGITLFSALDYLRRGYRMLREGPTSLDRSPGLP